MKRENTNTFKIICCAVATLFAFGMTLSLLGLLLPSNNSDNAPSTRFDQISHNVVRLSQLSIGARVKVRHDEMGDITFLIVDRDHEGYPENSTTLFSQKIRAARTLDASESDHTYGYSRYSLSNIDQWLNSTAEAGQWYSARHSTDQPPAYETDAGFLAGFDSRFVDIVQDTTITVATQVQGGFEEIVRKFFLPSRTELAGVSVNGVFEGAVFRYVARYASLSNYAVEDYFERTGVKLIAGNPWLYATRSLWETNNSFGCSYNAWYYNFQSCFPSDYKGVRPVCNIPSDTFVTIGNDGCYELFFF